MLQTFPALVIHGARQAGKSTLAAMLLDGRQGAVVTLDDPQVLAAATEAPVKGVEESLAGRAGDLPLRGLTQGENWG